MAGSDTSSGTWRVAWAVVIGLAATLGVQVDAGDPVADRPNWVTEVPVPVRQFRSSERAIAVDADGDPHVAYGGQNLIYAERSGAVWTIEVADTTLGAGFGADLELDAAGNAHIAHFDRPNDRVLYTTNAGGPWTTDVVDTVLPDLDLTFNSNFGGEVALALDAGGDAHLTYYNAAAGELRYATNATGSWVIESVDADGSGEFCDIAADVSGNAHIAYVKEGRVRADVPEFRQHTLRYATNASGNWKNELVDGGSTASGARGVGWQCSIALDGAGDVHIAHTDLDDPAPTGAAIHTTNTTGKWVGTILGGQTIFGGGSTSIAIDASDVVHVTFSESAGVGYTSNAGGSFSPAEIAAPDGSIGSIAVTPGGTVHIAHALGTELAVASGTTGSFSNDVFDVNEFDTAAPRIDTNAAGNAYFTRLTDAGLLLTNDATGSWQSELIDADATGLPPAVVIDGAGDAHVVYERRPITALELVYANNAGGGWLRTVLDTATLNFGDVALTLDGPDAHIVYESSQPDQIRYATNASGSFVDQLVDALPQFASAIIRDVAVDSGGFAHTAYGESETNDVVYATNASGSWTTEVVVAEASILTPFVTLALDSADVPHLAYEGTMDEFLFYGEIHYGTRGPSGWDLNLIIPEPAFGPVIEIDVNDDVHMAWDAGTFFDTDVGYATNRGGSWQYAVFDRGGLGARAFPQPTFRAREGDTVALIPIAPVGRIDVAGPDLAVHSDCTVHMVYTDITLGNVKYAVQTADVPAPVATVSFATSNGTASAGADYTATNFTARWGAGDTGARFAVVPLSDDDALEGNETVRLTLSNPTGNTTLGSPSTATLIIEDDEATPVDAEDTFILPKNVKVKLNEKAPQKSSLVAAGFFDTGTGPIDLSGPATLTIGGLTLSVAELEPKGKGFRLRSRGIDFTITPNRAGSSRAKFKLKAKRNLTDLVDPDGPIRIRFQGGSVDGEGEVLLTAGRYRLGRQRGTLVFPTVFPFKAKAGVKGGGGDTLAIQAGLGTLGDTPPTAPTVRIGFGPTFEQTLALNDFTKKGDKFVAKGPSGGLTSVTLDYGKEKLTVKGKGLGLGDFIDGGQPVLVTVEIEGVRTVAIRMVKKGKSLKY